MPRANLQLLYADVAAKRAAATWAAERGLTFVPDAYLCVHTLRKTRHGSVATGFLDCMRGSSALDHPSIWQQPDGSRFALVHVHGDRKGVIRRVKIAAKARGFVARIDSAASWYGYDTTTFRLTLPPAPRSTPRSRPAS